MKINKLKINSFGNLKNKEYNLKDNINIIYGENEAGKSTLLKFIVSCFYGISKNKRGRELSDYDRYKPWDNDDFSGKLEYELDNNSKYEVYRDFNKKSPKIFNSNMEDISETFNIDKNKGNEFFCDQTKISEDLFLSTLIVSQKAVELEKTNQNILIQKIANIVGTGEDKISYKKAIDKINKRQLEEIGTQRSKEKPINLLDKKIKEINTEIQELEKYKDFKYEIEKNESDLMQEILFLENKYNYLKELKILQEKEELEKEKINLKENIKKQNIEKINEIKKQIDKLKKENKNLLEKNKLNNKKNNFKENKKIIFLFILLILINILQFIYIKNKIFNSIFFLTVPMFLALEFILFKNKNNKIKMEENNKKIIKEKIFSNIINLENEINIITENNSEIENELNKIKSNFNLKINLEKEKIKNKYSNKLQINEINNFINLENLNIKISEIEKSINSKKIEIHKLHLDKENIEPKLDNLSKLEEKLVDCNEKMVNLDKLNKSINLAKQVLDDCYEEMKSTVTPKFTQNLSNNMSDITNGKYNKVSFSDESGLIVELNNGNYASISNLSVGTIEQLYLSLRFSMIDELSDEKLPIILDEIFAYYDENRLENTFKNILGKFKDRQIIIFTCSNREKHVLNNLNMKFNYISM